MCLVFLPQFDSLIVFIKSTNDAYPKKESSIADARKSF